MLLQFDGWVSAEDLMAEAERRGIGRIQSALSALSRRVGASYELPGEYRDQGLGLLMDVRRGSPNAYRLTAATRRVLRSDPTLVAE